MNATAGTPQINPLAEGPLSTQDVGALLKALGQWGVAEEAGVRGAALDEYADRARAAFMQVAAAA